MMRWVLIGIMLIACSASMANQAIAFYYAANPPWDELQAFDLVVVDPDHVPDPSGPKLARTELAAYVAVGEVQPSRAYAKALPAAWLRGENKDWGSRLIDQSQNDWPDFFASRVIAPLWQAGYRTFFLDTLDSYHLFAKSAKEKAAQEEGMVRLLHLVKQRFPQAKLIFNRGFEILSRTHTLVHSVAAESLFQGYDASKSQYRPVPAEDRQWLMGQLQRVKDEFKLPVIAIDYVPADQRELARLTAGRIQALGFTPWVATPALDTLGIGAIEVLPRKVLVVHSPQVDEYALTKLAPMRQLSMPLSYQGYVPVFVDTANLPTYPLNGRFAGAVVWLTNTTSAKERQLLTAWMTQQVQQKVPLSLFDPAQFLSDSAFSKLLGVEVNYPTPNRSPIVITQQDPIMGFERAPRPTMDDFYALTLKTGQPLLTLKQGANTQVGAAIMPWGGFLLSQYGIVTLPGEIANRWVIEPFAYLSKSLQLTDLPAPDVTTETGKRMLMVHMDGDGFISRPEISGGTIAGELVRDRLVKKYRLPMTISVIEAELSPKGLYPDLSALAERVARDIFSQPHVAIASHSYSHPFVWRKVSSGDFNEGYNLRLPGYEFSLVREIEGSIRYIEERLAPKGKKVDMFFWTGDCTPGSDALALTRKAGVLNMNGGETLPTKTQPTLTLVPGLGVARKGGFQVFAPNQNENVYTNNWGGPFYGFERVIETFEFTDKPRRLKPINIYFHSYITTKRASMLSIDKVFAYAMAQETTPVFVSDYARKVLDFQSMAIAKTPQGWRLRGTGDLRSLRLSAAMGMPDMLQSQSVAGYRTEGNTRYAHLSDDSVELVLTDKEQARPRLVSANASLLTFEQQAAQIKWILKGNVPLQFTLAHASTCRMSVAGQDLKPSKIVGPFSHYELKTHVAGPIEAICRT
jgi:polysaccharide biosynthesis protein PelA